MNINVTKITVVVTSGTDKIFLHTDLPSATWPYKEESQSLSIDAAHNTGAKYCSEHFPEIPVEVIIVPSAR
jgi:hypothetical protein